MRFLREHLKGTACDHLRTFESWRDAGFQDRIAYARGRNICVLNGCFDLFHVGHLNLIMQVKRHDFPDWNFSPFIVALLNSDASVAKLKGPNRPIVPLAQRLRMVTGDGMADVAAGFDEDTPLEALRAIRPGFLFKGASYLGTEVVGHDLPGCRVVFLPETPGVSTTAIEKRILAAHGGSAASRTDGHPPSPERP